MLAEDHIILQFYYVHLRIIVSVVDIPQNVELYQGLVMKFLFVFYDFQGSELLFLMVVDFQNLPEWPFAHNF